MAQSQSPKSILFAEGFTKYLQNGEFYDLELVSLSQNTSFKVHRMILAQSSEYFARLLLGDFKEASQSKIELKFPDPKNMFPQLLQYLYTGKVTLTLSNAIPLLTLADHYLVKYLKKLCTNFIFKNTTKNNVLEVLKTSIEFESVELVEHFSVIVSKTFCHIPQADFTFLPFSIFSQILHHKYLAVRDEHKLYKSIRQYIEAWKDDLQEEHIEQLMETIRFYWMGFPELRECERDPLVPRKLLLEAIMGRLRKFEAPDKETECPSSHRMETRIYCTTFGYEYDFDEKGVLFYIGTQGGTGKWTKPKGLNIFASSIEVGNVSDLVNRAPSELWTKDVPASWFTLDLGTNRSLNPTHYTLRHGGNYRADSLRTWDLQGSQDGKTWVVLRRHTNDTALTDKWAMNTWPITVKDESEKSQGYRFFRILQTGRNSSNHNFLVLSGIEFYGDLYEWQD